jgi:hypothetical protein
MKFWKQLRWIATVLFLLLLVGSWLGSATDGDQGCGPGCTPRPAPQILTNR